jgi:hypothetical protein
MGSNKNHEALCRQWLLLNRVPRKGKWATRDFLEALQAAGFDVSLRTVQRDLKELSRYFPLQCDDERVSSWKWAEDAAAFEVPRMDPHVALTFQMVKLHMEKLLPDSCLDYLRPYLKRAEEILDEHGDGGLAKWSNKIARISRHMSLEAPTINPLVHCEIYDGILLEKKVGISYRNRGTETAQEAQIHPLGLVFVDNVEYLVCTFWNYEDLRQIALHRIESATLLDEPMKRPEGFDLNEYIELGSFGIPQGEGTIRLRCLVVRSVAKHLEESPLNATQKLILQDDARFVLEADVLDTAQLQWWILGFGSQVEVVEPSSLRNQIAKTCLEMNEKYKASGN